MKIMTLLSSQISCSFPARKRISIIIKLTSRSTCYFYVLGASVTNYLSKIEEIRKSKLCIYISILLRIVFGYFLFRVLNLGVHLQIYIVLVLVIVFLSSLYIVLKITADQQSLTVVKASVTAEKPCQSVTVTAIT